MVFGHQASSFMVCSLRRGTSQRRHFHSLSAPPAPLSSADQPAMLRSSPKPSPPPASIISAVLTSLAANCGDATREGNKGGQGVGRQAAHHAHAAADSGCMLPHACPAGKLAASPTGGYLAEAVDGDYHESQVGSGHQRHAPRKHRRGPGAAVCNRAQHRRPRGRGQPGRPRLVLRRLQVALHPLLGGRLARLGPVASDALRAPSSGRATGQGG